MPLLFRLVLALFLSGAAIVHAAEPRMEVVLRDGELRLGDIFEGLGTEAGIVVAPAPDPGRRAVYDTAWLTRTAETFGVPWRPRSGREQVVVTRASLTLGAAEIAAELERPLLDVTGAGAILIELDNRAVRLHFPVVPDLGLQVEGIQFDPSTRRFAAELVATAVAGTGARHRVTGRTVELVDVPVLARTVQRGDVIRAEDLAWAQARADRLRAGVLTDPAELIGREARRPLQPGQPLHDRDVAVTTLVARGATVVMMVQTPVLTVTAQGRALDKGGAGDVIRVVNTSSNTIVQAVVTGLGQVNVIVNGADPARLLLSPSGTTNRAPQG